MNIAISTYNIYKKRLLFSLISPLSFNLPLEYTRLVAEHTKRLCDIEYGTPPDPGCIPFGPNHHLPKGKKAPLWISKPIAKSQGKGILLFDV